MNTNEAADRLRHEIQVHRAYYDPGGASDSSGLVKDIETVLDENERLRNENERFNADSLLACLRKRVELEDENERLRAELERLRYHDRHTDRQADACDICEGVMS